MKFIIFMLFIVIIGINLVIGVFTIGIFNEMVENNKKIDTLQKEIISLQQQVNINKSTLKNNTNHIKENYKRTVHTEKLINDNKNNIIISIDGKITKLSKDIRLILSSENEKANSKLNDVKIYLDELYNKTKKGLNNHDGNFKKLNRLLEEYADVAKFIHIQSKNGMTLRHLDKKD